MIKYILVILLSYQLSAQISHFVKYKSLETYNIRATFSNDGRLTSETLQSVGIIWPKDREQPSFVYEHGFWVLGFRNNTLVGAVPMYWPGYTPGPVISGKSAIAIAPEDSALYRSYFLDKDSGPGDDDYDEWPLNWGAPFYRNGSPKITGDIMLWTVYNDAHPEVKFNLEQNQHNTFIEVRESIWGYNKPGILGDVLFFKWQIYNKSNQPLDSVMICHWNDINIVDPSWDLSGYDLENDFGYIYDKYIWQEANERYDTEILSFFLLQGPVISNYPDIGYSFGQELIGYSNLSVTGFWGIDSDTIPFWLFGALPRTLQEIYYFATGRRHDGSLIINPISGDTTAFTYIGNPITKEGWIMTDRTGGESGYLMSSGPFTMAPSDSQEIIIALTAVRGDSLKDAYNKLSEKIEFIRSFYNDSLKIIPEEPPLIPETFILNQNYPNPFNSETKIKYSIPSSGEIKISFYNVLGELIETIVKNHDDPGIYNIKVYLLNKYAPNKRINSDPVR
jgi:hypothetical protein